MLEQFWYTKIEDGIRQEFESGIAEVTKKFTYRLKTED